MHYKKLLLCSCVINFLIPTNTYAQIIPDRSLGVENSIVIPNATVKNAAADLIEGGAIRGDNLFHSFEQFNISDGARVYFANPDGIANILSRVTGSNASQIFGKLGVDGAANLFLLNPNGIVFGQNAALDVNGSFLATTADSYIFDNGFIYSASHLDTPPLLTINIPLGLQFGTNSAPIEVKGIGNQLILDPISFEFLFRNIRPKGLEVASGNTLALVGGAINLTGGNLTAPQGRIELGSVTGKGDVSLIPRQDGFTFDYGKITNFDNINLRQSASIDVSGSGSGNIQLQGKNISLSDASAIISNTLNQDNGGTIQISAVDTFKIISAEGGFFPSGVFSQVESTAIGNGGNLNVEARNIEITQNALINNSISGAGNGGEIYIKTEKLIVTGSSSASFYPTGIYSQVSPLITATGKSSDLTVEADSINITNGALIATATFSAGNSGNISIQADSLELSGSGSLFLFSDNPIPSGIFTTVVFSFVTGNGGDITIDTISLNISDGGQIRAGTLGLGNSGNIFIKAEEISITDTLLLLDSPVASGVFSSSGLGILTGDIEQTTGNGGNINIETGKLTLATGGQIGAGTSSTGDSGNLSIKAQDINIAGQLFDNENEAITGFANTSGLFTSVVRADALGSGGDILVEAENLQIFDGGAIAANVFGAGEGGDIQINANNISVSNSFVVSDVRSGITTTVESTGTGNAGNIEIVANNLSLINGGSIAASAIGNGNAGDLNFQLVNLDISGVSFEGEFESQIAAFAQNNSAAGTINIVGKDVQISDRGSISVSNLGGGNSGNLNISTNQLSLDDLATIEAKVNAGNQGNINLNTDNILLTNNSEITSEATGTARGGDINIENQDNIVLLENSQIIADAIQGNGGNINITTQGFFITYDSLISASSEFGLDGNIEINTPEDQSQQSLEKVNYNFISIDELISNRCFGSQFSDNSSFTYVGRGSLPINPETRIDEGNYLNEFDSVINDNVIIEANAIAYNDKGKIVLINRSFVYDTNSLEFEPVNLCQSH